MTTPGGKGSEHDTDASEGGRRRALVIAGAGAVVAVLLGLGLFVVLDDDRPSRTQPATTTEPIEVNGPTVDGGGGVVLVPPASIGRPADG